MAGWLSASIPKWLVILGLISASACILSSVFIISILTEGRASILIEVGSLTGMLWLVCSGYYMLRRTTQREPVLETISKS